MALLNNTMENSKDKQWENVLKSSSKMIEYAKQLVEDGEIIEGFQTLEMNMKSLSKKHF
jgi:hypothetical protein